ncbi:MAG: hypothetical protein H6621_11500 [Halobacteriovoraceae bacterium]|nr:hypothetical protein [Halobacteriovoraceae bacterium]MCB9095685.1 hypothetical protein [Halobacteriovoraceae bacterium]
MKFAILVFIFSFGAFAQENPFEECEQYTNNIQYYRCNVSILDSFIKEDLGEKELEKANELVDESCKKERQGFKIDPELNMLSQLDCEFEVKIDYYNSKI